MAIPTQIGGRFRLPWLALFFSALLAAPASAQQDAGALADRVDAYYNRLRTLKADFVEIYRGAGMERRESGTLWLKKPGKMRWDYRQPQAKLFLTDGKTAWLYLPAERQARRAPVKQLDDLRSPLRYLLGKTRLRKELAGLSLAPDVAPLADGNTVLRGVPKGLEDRVAEVLLEVTPGGQITRLVLEEVDGSTTEFRFNGHETDAAIADQRFQFVVPAGVEVVEMREVGP